MQHIEEALSHLVRTVDDLSDIVARQEREISVLTTRVALLMEREAEREAQGGVVSFGDDAPPPHY